MHVRHWGQITILALGGFLCLYNLQRLPTGKQAAPALQHLWSSCDTEGSPKISTCLHVGEHIPTPRSHTESKAMGSIKNLSAQISLLPLSHPRPTKPLQATCCVSHRCKKHFLHYGVWGETRVNGLGRLPGVLEARWAMSSEGMCAGLSSSPRPDRPHVPAADPSPAPGPWATLCHATRHLDQEAAVVRGVIFLKAHFPVQGGSRWKAEPLKGRYFERPHRRSSHKRASGAGIYPKLSNWPSLLIWDLMPPNQTNSKSHLLNFSAQLFFKQMKAQV